MRSVTSRAKIIRSGAHILWLALLLILAGCAPQEGIALTLAGYTAPREACGKIIPLFQDYWRSKTGETVRVRESYLGSSAQSRAIVGGFEADVAVLSMEPDIDRIQRAGLIRHDWKKAPYGGIVTHSVVVLAARAGNPERISGWQDLARPGLAILTPNPKLSGGAMWNLLAVYGAVVRGKVGGYEPTDEGAKRLLRDILKNVTVLDKGARESIINFERGIGDVLITYENEAVTGRKESGVAYEMIHPVSTVLIESPVAVIDRYVDQHGTRAVAEAFRDFLWSREAQAHFAAAGYRPVHPDVARQTASFYKPVEDLWRIQELGSWDEIIPRFFGTGGIVTRIMEDVHREKQKN